MSSSGIDQGLAPELGNARLIRDGRKKMGGRTIQTKLLAKKALVLVDLSSCRWEGPTDGLEHVL
jgi:hypothetical protein